MRSALVAAFVLAALLGAPVAAQMPEEYEWPNGAYNPFGHSPIRLWFDDSNLTEPVRGYAAEVDRAIAYWESGGNGALRWEVDIERVASREEADILLWFRDSSRVGPTCFEAAEALGCAIVWKRPLPIEIITRDANGAYRPYLLMREVAMHEVGHALGLPHSDDAGDVMKAHASRRAAAAWRPGEGAPALVGIGVSAVAAVASVALFGRYLRREARRARLGVMTEEEAEAMCPDSEGAAHEFVPVTVDGARYAFCRACRRAREL